MSRHLTEANEQQHETINTVIKALHECLLEEMAKIESCKRDNFYLINTLFGVATGFNGFILHKLSLLTPLDRHELLEAYVAASSECLSGELKGNLQ